MSGFLGTNGQGLVGNPVANYRTESEASFWDQDVTQGSTTHLYAGNLTDPKLDATPQTTAAMQDQTVNIYTAKGWDFTPGTGVWKWPAADGYPILQWQTE